MIIYHTKKSEVRFCRLANGKIKNTVEWNERVPVPKKSVLLHIKDLDLTVETSLSDSWASSLKPSSSYGTPSYGTSRACLTSAVFAAASLRLTALLNADWQGAHELWKNQKKITGSVFLTATGDLIWISDIDLKHFKVVQ